MASLGAYYLIKELDKDILDKIMHKCIYSSKGESKWVEHKCIMDESKKVFEVKKDDRTDKY